MKRGKPLQPNLQQIQAWQRRSQQAAIDRLPSKAKRVAKRAARRRNDGPWRAEVLSVRGTRCRSCDTTRYVQADHVIPRAQGGPSVLANGLPLCGGFANGCHDAKTAGRLKIHHAWLDVDQIEWLHEAGHAWWLPDGSVAGPHCRLFASEPDRRPKA